MKLYDRVLKILTENKMARNSDKVLIWEVFKETGTVSSRFRTQQLNGLIDFDAWMDSVSTESVRRCRQKIQELHPELQADNVVQTYRKGIQKQKGTHVFRETINLTWVDPMENR